MGIWIALGVGLVAGGIGGALVYAVVEEDGANEAAVASTPTASREIPADCGYGVPVELEGQTVCSFAFDATDVPARLTGTALPGSMEGDITLHATCSPMGTCVKFQPDNTLEDVSEERNSRIDWQINAPASIVINAGIVVQTDSLPVREYRFIDFAYDHPSYGKCGNESLCQYIVTAKYEQTADSAAPSPTPATEPGTTEAVPVNCGIGTEVEADGERACSVTFEAVDVPGILWASAHPGGMEGDVVLKATCSPQARCTRLLDGKLVTDETTNFVDWKINEAGTLAITALATVETNSLPVRTYHFVDFTFQHGEERVCTGESLYCYIIRANYERTQ
jgi:hypothetical protein